MDFKEYQKAALRTFAQHNTINDGIHNSILGLCGEVGEVADYWKKHIFHGHKFNPEKIKEELGDILFYLATTCEAFGFELEQVAQFNIDKLKERYPHGFSTERSQQRDE